MDCIKTLMAIDFLPAGIFPPEKTSNIFTFLIKFVSTSLINFLISPALKSSLIIKAKSLSDFWYSEIE